MKTCAYAIALLGTSAYFFLGCGNVTGGLNGPGQDSFERSSPGTPSDGAGKPPLLLSRTGARATNDITYSCPPGSDPGITRRPEPGAEGLTR